MKTLSTSGSHVAELKVLIVDDDEFVSSVMVDMITTLGVTTIHQSINGKDALRFIDNNSLTPDLVFCDLAMPGSDGFQLMEELGKRDFRGGVVLVSGQKDHVLHSATLMARFHQLNILASLEKPVSMQQLQSVLEDFERKR
jgi:response regulator of citrate/malate metabolism